MTAQGIVCLLARAHLEHGIELRDSAVERFDGPFLPAECV
jgi:hypothetical protein